MNINQHVCLATAQEIQNLRPNPRIPNRFQGGGRVGTLFCTLQEFAFAAGDPHCTTSRDRWYDYEGEGIDGAGKVTAEWHIRTPRGLATIHDFWSSPKGVLSVGVAIYGDSRSALWVIRWLRAHGFTAVFGIERTRP